MLKYKRNNKENTVSYHEYVQQSIIHSIQILFTLFSFIASIYQYYNSFITSNNIIDRIINVNKHVCENEITKLARISVRFPNPYCFIWLFIITSRCQIMYYASIFFII